MIVDNFKKYKTKNYYGRHWDSCKKRKTMIAFQYLITKHSFENFIIVWQYVKHLYDIEEYNCTSLFLI
jgi:hypothetical protein